MDSLPILSSVLIIAAVYLALTSWRDVWDRIAGSYVRDLTPQLRALNIDQRHVPTLLRLWGGAILAAFSVVVFAPPLALAAIFFVFIAPRVGLSWMISRRKNAIRDQLADASVALANTTRAGLSLYQGMASVANKTPNPLGHELHTIVREVERGLPMKRAIENTKTRLDVDEFALLSAALLTSLERGGKITDTLDRIARSLRETQRLERKMLSETASGKKALNILACFPLFFMLLFWLLYPEGVTLLVTTLAGQVILLIVIALIYMSWTWGQRILTLDD